MERQSLDRICATLSYALGIDPPKEAAPRHDELSAFVDQIFGGDQYDVKGLKEYPSVTVVYNNK